MGHEMTYDYATFAYVAAGLLLLTIVYAVKHHHGKGKGMQEHYKDSKSKGHNHLPWNKRPNAHPPSDNGNGGKGKKKSK